jgi:HSP20 family protein
MFYNRTVKDYRSQMRRPLNNVSFNERPSYERGFDQMSQFNRGFESNCSQWGYATPQTDILELDDQYILEIALPGVVLDDVELKVEENTLTVVAKRTPAMFEERAHILRKELPAGHLVREFEFDTEILHDQIEARMDRGILFVSIPKVEVALRIPVSAGNLEGHLSGMKTRVNKSENMQNRKQEVTIK